MNAKNFSIYEERAVSYFLVCSLRVFNGRTYRTQENMHANQLEGEARTYIVPYAHLWCI